MAGIFPMTIFNVKPAETGASQIFHHRLPEEFQLTGGYFSRLC
jgi:hypothetical protein